MSYFAQLGGMNVWRASSYSKSTRLPDYANLWPDNARRELHHDMIAQAMRRESGSLALCFGPFKTARAATLATIPNSWFTSATDADRIAKREKLAALPVKPLAI